MKYLEYQKLIRVLRKKVPAAFPVEVRRVKLVGRDGYCEKRGGQFRIRVSYDLTERMAIDTLLHEWAHARAWNHLLDNVSQEDFDRLAHDPAWGVAYSEVYRVFEEYVKSGQ